MSEYIKLDDCKNGGYYRIGSRNLSRGVYRESTKGFIGIREKFGEKYLFEEYHWDTGAPFGTVRPLEFLGMYPNEPSEGESKVITEEDLKLYPNATWLKVGDKVFIENKELRTWLEEKEQSNVEDV